MHDSALSVDALRWVRATARNLSRPSPRAVPFIGRVTGAGVRPMKRRTRPASKPALTLAATRHALEIDLKARIKARIRWRTIFTLLGACSGTGLGCVVIKYVLVG